MVLIKEPKQDPEKWHSWFAWHPVYCPRVGLVWLETVSRRFDMTPLDVMECWCWEYKGMPTGD